MSNSLDEVELLKRVIAGEKEAYTPIVEHHSRRLRSSLSYYCSSSELVEEILQESFVQAYFALQSFDLKRSFYPWLKTIAMNHLRKIARHKKVVDHKSDDYLYHLQLRQLNDLEDDSELFQSHLISCLNKLNPDQVELIQEKYTHNVSLQNLADRYQKKVNALKVQLHRLRQQLKDCIEQKMLQT